MLPSPPPIRFPILACLWLLPSLASFGANLTESEIADLFSQSKELFRKANAATASDPGAARELYRKSALRLERIVREGGVENGKLYYNIGNAYFRMNDLGRAILNYRRAEQFIPNDPNLRQNLDFARLRRTDKIEGEAAEQKKQILRTLFFWHYDFSVGARSVIFGVSFALVWLAAGLRLFLKRTFLKWIVGISAVVSALLLGSLIAESLSRNQKRPGVIVAEEVTARKGDSETYEQAFQEPLHAGTEFALLEDRSEWLHVELADSRRCWLPSNAVELVR